MATALVDTTALYTAANRRARRHESGRSIVRAADEGALPVLRLPDPVVVETMNGVTRAVGHDTAVDLLDRLRRGSQFELHREPMAVWTAGSDRFERTEQLSLADALLVASASHHELESLYSFDDDFDGIDGLTRLQGAEDPYAP